MTTLTSVPSNSSLLAATGSQPPGGGDADAFRAQFNSLIASLGGKGGMTASGANKPLDGNDAAQEQAAIASLPGGTIAQGGPDDFRAQFNSLIASLGGKGGMTISGTNKPLNDDDAAQEQAAIASLQAKPDTPTPPPAPALSVNGNTIDTGRYTLTASTDDTATVKVHDKQTNTDFDVHGDPHVEDGAGDKAEFQSHALSVSLADGTTVQFDPTALNKKHVAFLSDVQVSKGGQTAQINFSNGGVAINGNATASAPQGDAIYLTAAGDLNHLQFSAGADASKPALTSGGEANLDDHASAAPPPPAGGQQASPSSAAGIASGTASAAEIEAMLAARTSSDAVQADSAQQDAANQAADQSD